MPAHQLSPIAVIRLFPLPVALRSLSRTKYVARIIFWFAVIWSCLLPGRTRAQAYPNPEVTMYMVFEGSINALYVMDADQMMRYPTYVGSNGSNNIMRVTNVVYPVASLTYLGAGVEYWTVAVSPTGPSESLCYPITESALNNTSLLADIPVYKCTPLVDGTPTESLSSRVRFMVVMITPPPLESSSFNKTICAGASVQFSETGTVVGPSDRYMKKTVEWEYSLNGAGWQPMGTSANEHLNFTPLQRIPEVKNARQSARFHYRYKIEYPSATLYSPYSPASDPIDILPAPPSLRDRSAVDSTASCKGMETGSIRIAGSNIASAFGEMRWLLRKGNVTEPCDPGNPTSCGNLDKWSPGNVRVSDGIDIRGLAPDVYSLWIINPGENAGSCYAPVVITVGELAELTAAEDNTRHKNVSCYGGNDGTIGITAAGADPGGTYTFTLLSGGVPIITDRPGTGKSVLFEQLPAGTYRVQVKNSTCNTTIAVTGNILITQPPRVSGYLAATSPKCVSPGDGAIDIQASATDGAVANYAFNLYRNGDPAPFKQSGAVMTDRYTFTDLPGGNYRVEVLNSDVNCPGWDSTVTLSTLIPLTLNIDPVDSISCYGAREGRLVCTATGGSGAYEYTLLQNNTSIATNTTGVFTDLFAGNYTVTAKNQGNTCNDQATKSISIYERSALQVNLQQTPISCYGEDDALIKSVVNGGSGSYYYHWQELKNGAWSDNTIWLGTDTQIEALAAGTYHLIITDNKAPGCSATSTESTVQAATTVKIAGITVHDAVCLADGAHIEMTGAGGTGTYLYEWSVDGGAYQPFTADTDIHTAGTYKLRLSDGHGCIVDAAASYAIIMPAAPVSFTSTLSDYAGYNISCKGNDNGFAQITATGGNGGNYSGYLYALDNNPYSDAALVEHINAGTHTLHVKDGRGCIVSQQITMTEPAAILGLTVSNKEHNGCGADPIGTISVAPQGGTAPYKYAIADQPWQDNPVFTGLTAKDYRLQVRDAAGCTTDITTTLTSLYTSLTATADITNVNCYGESNGALKLHVSGGDGNYNYQWNDPAISGDGAENIAAGDYTVTITDSKGCKQALTYTVSQPALLTLEVSAPPVCDGLGDGTLSTLVTGGTTPYQYALDQSSWLPAGTFNGLTPGNYHIAVKDAHNCTVDQDVTISKANTKPDINFLVASRKNAFDTLVIKEINVPAPDNVSWNYHPAAVLLGNENGTPLIKFTDPGSYWVEMTATFGTCTYVLRKDLEIGNYDPNAGPGYSVPVHVIDTVTLSPNPNNGNFNFKIKLNRKQQVVAYVYDMNGIIAGKKQYAPTLLIDDSFSVGGSMTGTFILRVITETESRDVRFIISR
ncbi:SprB repeat-containing protein [Chitinophaga filiformis]|uniref:SprB repeat-containing protein n=1 Tax=Chitinophaga filiformis TaxID=104663 RepID=UPI001F1AFC60|nr:SprB repeat-containing protein [Chitinophaga filiformis]MCF6407530.1 SprB repeat-containing protein [Chitinophaga filiformis]